MLMHRKEKVCFRCSSGDSRCPVVLMVTGEVLRFLYIALVYN